MILTQTKQQMPQTKSIEDYRRDIKLLKLKYLQLQQGFANQQKKIEWYNQKLRTMEKISSNNMSNQVSFDLSFINNQSLNQSMIQNKNANTNNFINYDQQIMEQFSNRCKQYLGMTPESLFRAADIFQKGTLKDVSFKQFLLNSKLNLKVEHIQRIIQLCDQDCSGNITKKAYYECLQAFQINQESMLGQDEIINGEGNIKQNRTYCQKSFYKFCENLIQQMISPYICFKYIDQSNVKTLS